MRPTISRKRRVRPLVLAVLAALIGPTARQAGAGYIYSVTDLGGLGGTGNPQVTGLNATGEVTGYAYTTGAINAYLYNGTKMNGLGAFVSGGGSYGSGVNAGGEVVGYGAAANGYQHAFASTGGPIQDLGTLGGNNSYAYSVNAGGQIVGYSNNAAGSIHAFLYSAGTGMTDLSPHIGGSYSVAQSINDGGEIAGYYGSSGGTHAFTYNGGTFTDLGTLVAGGTSAAQSISTNGEVVGYASTATGQHAFASTGGPLHDLGTLGGSNSYAYGVNDSGQVVGVSLLADNSTSHAFLYTNGALTDLNSLIGTGTGWTIVSANAINDAGQIAATASNAQGQTRAVLLSLPPVTVPEPPTLALLGSGMAMGLAMRRLARRKMAPAC